MIAILILLTQEYFVTLLSLELTIITSCSSCGITDNGICFNVNDTTCIDGGLGIGTGSIHDCCLVKEGSGNYVDTSGRCNACKLSYLIFCLYTDTADQACMPTMGLDCRIWYCLSIVTSILLKVHVKYWPFWNKCSRFLSLHSCMQGCSIVCYMFHVQVANSKSVTE